MPPQPPPAGPASGSPSDPGSGPADRPRSDAASGARPRPVASPGPAQPRPNVSPDPARPQGPSAPRGPDRPATPPPAPRIVLPESDEDLLDECEVETYRSSGKGGQHVNKTESAVRLRHLATGLVVSCQEDRSQYQNKQTCLRKLRERVEALNARPKPRKATRVPGRAKRASRKAKTHQSRKKQSRRGEWSPEDE